MAVMTIPVLHGGHPFFREIAPRIAQAVGEAELPIVTRGAIDAGPLPSRYWFYNTEDLHHARKRTHRYMAILNRAERVFDYAQPNLTIYPRAEFCPIALGDRQQAAADRSDIGVLFFGYVTERRRAILRALRAVTIDRAYGDDLTAWIRRAQIVISLGAHDNVCNDSFRVFPALERGGRLLVESCREPWFDRIVSGHATVAPYDQLVMRCQSMLSS